MVGARITASLLILISAAVGMSAPSWAQPEQYQNQTPGYSNNVPVVDLPPPKVAPVQDQAENARARDLNFRELLGRLNNMGGNQDPKGLTTPETTTPADAGSPNAGQ